MGEFFRAVRGHYDTDIVGAGKQPEFLIFLSFVLTFIAVRGITHAIRAGKGKRFFRDVSSGGRHIHHLVWGILLLLITGYIGLAFDRVHNVLAVFFGIGAALTLDEFALWLNLEDVYWAKQGRRSIDAVFIFAGIVGFFLVGFAFLGHVLDEVRDLL